MRDQAQLNAITEEFDKRANAHPGLGMVLFVFDAAVRGRMATKLSIALKGIEAKDAVRMLREQADNIERAERDAPRIVSPNMTQILKSSKH